MSLNLTDDSPPHYGKLPGVHPRHKKKIFIADKSHLDGEDATQAINTNDPMKLKEQFVDQLPDVVCYDGYAGLNQAFNEWKQEQKQLKTK